MLSFYKSQYSCQHLSDSASYMPIDLTQNCQKVRQPFSYTKTCLCAVKMFSRNILDFPCNLTRDNSDCFLDPQSCFRNIERLSNMFGGAPTRGLEIVRVVLGP